MDYLVESWVLPALSYVYFLMFDISAEADTGRLLSSVDTDCSKSLSLDNVSSKGGGFDMIAEIMDVIIGNSRYLIFFEKVGNSLENVN
jgi:hypothetical protein